MAAAVAVPEADGGREFASGHCYESLPLVLAIALSPSSVSCTNESGELAAGVGSAAEGSSAAGAGWADAGDAGDACSSCWSARGFLDSCFFGGGEARDESSALSAAVRSGWPPRFLPCAALAAAAAACIAAPRDDDDDDDDDAPAVNRFLEAGDFGLSAFFAGTGVVVVLLPSFLLFSSGDCTASGDVAAAATGDAGGWCC